MDSKSLIRTLEADGWYLDRVNGSHNIFKHPNKPGHLSIPHPKKDLPPGTLNQILKKAGLK